MAPALAGNGCLAVANVRNAVTEAIAAQIFPDVLRRVQFGRVGRKWQEDDVFIGGAQLHER